MSNTASLKKEYQDRIVPALTKEFGYKSVMQVPVLKKIVINQGLGMATADKKIIDIAISELSTITGQKAVATVSKKDISNFKLRKKMPIGVMVTLRREQMYEFLERLVRVALPRIRDFKGIESKLDGRGNYTLGIQEQIIFPEINIDSITRILGMNINLRQKVTMRLCRLYLKMLLLYVCTTVARLQDVRKGMYASSVFLVSNCVKWHLMV